MFFKTYWILWQNARNLKYIWEYNDNFARNLADNKIKTKEFLSAKGVNVPESLAIIKNHNELDKFDYQTLSPPFVIKPNAWFWWQWILIFESLDADGNFVTKKWTVYTKQTLEHHLREILDGFFSLSWTRDKIIIEKKIELDEGIELIWKYGLPDIRVIVFKLVPVIAMLRIPTEESWWTANTHSWACAVWIDIWSGILTYITHYNKVIKSVPWIWDIRWLKIPYWEDILKMSAKLQKITNIWYLACDIVLDKNQWPSLLEVNIRPGLSVQVANLAPLASRLRKLDGVSITSEEKWVRLWMDLFWGDIEDKIESISWKRILWQLEYISICIGEKHHQYIAEISISEKDNIIDSSFVTDILKIEISEINNNKIRLKYKLLWEEQTADFLIWTLSDHNIVLWRRSLRWDLIDPNKYKKGELPSDYDINKEKNIVITKNYEHQLLRIDKALIGADKKLMILKYLTPNNLIQEKINYINKKGDYIPQFTYEPLKIELDKIREEVEKIDFWDLPLSELYRRKKDEVILKLDLLKAFQDDDYKKLADLSKKLYGDVTEENLLRSFSAIESKGDIVSEEEFLVFEEIENIVKKFNHIYGIDIRPMETANMVSRFAMSANRLKVKAWTKIWKNEFRSIIAHEVEWHYLRKFNWKKLMYSIFSYGTAWYLPTEEGVAIYNQYRLLTPKMRKFFSIYERYKFVHSAVNSSHEDLMKEFIEFYKWDLERVFTYFSRLKRGARDVTDEWVFMKDVVYLNGYAQVEQFIEEWWDLKDLFIWKIGIDDIDYVKSENILWIKQTNLVVPMYL